MHTFKIAKIAQVIPDNLLTFKSVNMNGTFGTKPANKKGYIEFIGDSITAGLGILSHNLYEQLSSNYSDPTLAYAWQVADAFDADRSLVCAGGIGIGSGAVANSNKANNPWRQSDCYPYTCAYRNWTSSGLFKPTRTPNVVVINLGTNDWMQLKNVNYSGQKGRPTVNSYVDVNGNLHEGLTPQQSMDGAVETVKECYKKLLKQVRGYYGNVPILCCVGMMDYGYLADTNKSSIQGLYNKAVAETSITNTYFTTLQSCKSNGTYGMDVGGADHPFYTSHVKNAQLLINYIKGKGWMGTTPTAPTTQKTEQTQQTTQKTTQQTTQQTTVAPVTGDTYMPASQWNASNTGTWSMNGSNVTLTSNDSIAEYSLYDYGFYSKKTSAPSDANAIRFTLTVNSVGNKNVPLEVYAGGNNTGIGKYSGTFVSLGTGNDIVGKTVTYTVKFADFAGGANGSEKRSLTGAQMAMFNPLEFRVRAKDMTTGLGSMSYTLSDIKFVNDSSVATTTKATTTTTITKATTTKATPDVKKGDVNHDGVVNALDLQMLLSKVASGKTSDDYASDVNSDGKVDILDVKALLVKLL